MQVVTAGLAARLNQTLETVVDLGADHLESVRRMMSMVVLQETNHAEVIVSAVHTGDHFLFVKICIEPRQQQATAGDNIDVDEGKKKYDNQQVPLRQTLQIRFTTLGGTAGSLFTGGTVVFSDETSDEDSSSGAIRGDFLRGGRVSVTLFITKPFMTNRLSSQ